MGTTERVRRTVAVAAAAGGAGHLTMATVDSRTAWVFAVMGVLCLPCAAHLWRHDSRRSWAMVAFGAVGMVAIHFGLIVRSPGAGPHHHLVFATTGHLPAPAHLALLTALEALVVAGVLWAAPRHPSRNTTRSTP
ncbi:hypothetical protein QRX60_45025 [Amycolatopsis mongoliensis]|uniref:Uncharacterized protein n=1 Tax=Amycolatopsis mongoliensis TaxID=715475 RepID=A0A9Y2NCX5_9PSEU|nr:hypothetical protein [Amycolatopsis sp. 4-36]WIY01126.1 hypothetical protein QRX60_45025 [Amycolatopsis sp. 4-36]